MVLQQGQPVPVWGWATPGEKVTVEFGGQSKRAVADKSGNWKIRLDSLAISATPAELTINGANRVVYTNVLVGEVWLCSGQSNMEKPIGEQRGQKPVLDAEQELASGDNFPQIRLFKVKTALAATPEKDVTGEWSVCSSNALEATKFSAAAYFFGREITRELNEPVGLIESSWGGTRIEPWTPPLGFKSVRGLSDFAKPIAETNRLRNTTPMAIYNAMIAPLATFAMRGALWYQGESNCMGDKPDGAVYTDKMEAMIRGWRKVWGEGDFPFYYVQIAPFKYYTGRVRRVPYADALPEIWEAQTAALRIKHTGMAVTTDLVDSLNDIHPRDKRAVGYRLSLMALAGTYGKTNVVSSGPMFRRMKVQGGKVVLYFDHTNGGLTNKDGNPLTWFTVAGADGKFVPADAAIAGDTVVVSSPSVAEPKAVRFAWSEVAQPNLFNQAGLPAVPFRTDAKR